MTRITKIIYNTIIVLFLIGAIIYVATRFMHPGKVEYTDAARTERHVVPVNNRVQGFIKEIRFEEYSHVEKGDTLLLIEDSEYKTALARAAASYQMSLSGKSADVAGLSSANTNITVVDAGIDEAKVLLDNAEADYLRYKALLEKDAVTKQQFDAVETQYKAAQARYEQVKRQRGTATSAGKQQEGRLDQSEAAVELAKAEYELASLNLSYTAVIAPCSGMIGPKKINVGELVQPGQQLAKIVDESRVWVTADYRERQLRHIAVGSPVTFTADAIPGVKYNAVVTSVADATGASWQGTAITNATGNFVKVEQRVPVLIDLTEDNDSEDVARLSSGLNVQVKVKF